ncbi:TPA: chromate transporter [Clostridium perfringens]
MILIRLFLEFFKVGLFAVGGGAATIPFLYNISDKTHWFTHTDLANMIAISQSVPGAMGINMATYVGYATDGVAGAITSTIGIIVPSIIIILVVARVLAKFKENKRVADCFYGLRPASTGLLLAAGFEIVKISILTLDKYDKTHDIFDIVSFKALILAVILYFLINKFKKSPIFYIAISAIIGIIFNFVQ